MTRRPRSRRSGPMPPLDIRDAITIVTGVVTLSGVVFTLRVAVAKLENGQAELLRQLSALHKRIDHFGERLSRTEIEQARLGERIAGLRDSQRFRLSLPGDDA